MPRGKRKATSKSRPVATTKRVKASAPRRASRRATIAPRYADDTASSATEASQTSEGSHNEVVAERPLTSKRGTKQQKGVLPTKIHQTKGRNPKPERASRSVRSSRNNPDSTTDASSDGHNPRYCQVKRSPGDETSSARSRPVSSPLRPVSIALALERRRAWQQETTPSDWRVTTAMDY